MSLIRMNFFSNTLNMYAPVELILPQPRHGEAEPRELPCLMLLHGLGDDHTSWQRKTALERYARAARLAVILPDGALSCYANMAHGARYRDYIADELPRVMREIFPLSAKREKNFIAGCSMGGFGALKLGFAEPEKWSAIGILSAAHMEYRPDSATVQAALYRAYGGDIDACDARVVRDVLRDNDSGPDLRVWHAWGDADSLREAALKSQSFFKNLPVGRIHYHSEEHPGGHNWALWDALIERFIAWLDIPAAEPRR